MRFKKLEYVMALSFVGGAIFLIIFAIDRKSYFFYPCIVLLAITIISYFADIIMQKAQKRKEIKEISE